MEILGVNIGETSEGVNLKDGGVTSITDGIITMSIPEDRISRKKHKGGFSESLDYLLLRRGLSVNDVDRIYISTLGEEVDKNVFELPDIKRLIGKHPSILKCIRPTGSHHLNHAYSVFPFSNFENALIVIAHKGETPPQSRINYIKYIKFISRYRLRLTMHFKLKLLL